MKIPYLEGEIRHNFDRWLEETVARLSPPLTFTEIRKGVQAVTEIYGSRSGNPEHAAKAIEGQGKRAALATFFASLHFLTTHHALVMIGEESFGPVRRIYDLGCGSGSVGAAAAQTLGGPVRMIGIDRSGWALDETKQTWRAFGLNGKLQRAELPGTFPKTARGDLICMGWTLSELSNADRAILLRRTRAAVRRGVPVLILETISQRSSTWWSEWEESLGELGVRSEMIRVPIDRPFWIQDMDKAARLDHQVIGARVLAAPSREKRATE